MVLDFNTGAPQALTERYGHTAEKVWATQRMFPSGPVKVLLTDVSVGRVTNVGFVAYTFIYASYIIGIYKRSPGVVGKVAEVRINKYWGVSPGWQSLGSTGGGSYSMITQLDYVRVGADGKNLDFPLPAECRTEFRVTAG